MDSALIKRLRRGFGWAFAGQVAGFAIGFITAPILTRALPPEEYAVVGLGNSMRSILLILLPMGTAGAVSYWYNLHREKPEDRDRAVSGIAGLSLLISFCWFIAILALGALVQPWLPPDALIPFWPHGALVAATAWLLSLQTIPMILLTTTERQDRFAQLNVITILTQTAFVLLLVVLWKRRAEGQIEGFFIAALCCSPIWLFILVRHVKPKMVPSMWGQVFAYSLPLMPHTLAGWGLNLSDRLIIAHHGDRFAADLGLYTFAYAVAGAMQAVMVGFNSIWAPVYMEQAKSNPDAKKTLGETASWSMLALAIAASGLILFAPAIVMILTPPKDHASFIYIAPVALAYFMQATYMFPAMSLFHLKQTRRLPIITVSSVALNITLNLLLVPHFGVIVAAWSTLAGYSLMTLLAFLLCHRLFPLEYSLRPILLAAALLGVSVPVALIIPNTLLGGVLRAALWGGSAAAAFLLWRRRPMSRRPSVAAAGDDPA